MTGLGRKTLQSQPDPQQSVGSSRVAPGVAARCLSAIVLIVAPGCSPDSASSSAVSTRARAVPTSAEDAVLIPHPEYVNWSQFPVGTSVVREKEVIGFEESLRVVTTLRLAEKSDERVKVLSQTTIHRPDEPAQENPPLEFIYAARFSLPKGLSAAAFSLPALKARLIGDEVVEVADEEFVATLFTWNEVNETGAMAVKYWRSDAVPGRFVRQSIAGPNHRSQEQVTAIQRLPQ